MYVLQVVPLSPTAPVSTLTYRSVVAFPQGSLVTIPLRKQFVTGVVLESLSVREAKTLIKEATYALKKSDVTSLGIIEETLLSKLSELSKHSGVSLGSVLRLLLKERHLPLLTQAREKPGSAYKRILVERTLPERFKEYEALIRDAKGVALLVVPSTAEVRYAKEYFKKSKPHVHTTGEIPEDATLIITTPGEAFIPHPRLSLVVLERVSAGSYKLLKRPFLNVEPFIEALAMARGAQCVYGDYPLPLELRPVPTRAPDTALLNPALVLNPTLEEAQSVFKPLTESVQGEMRTVLERKGVVLVLSSRKGYSPGVVCRDCGNPVLDEYGRRLVFSTHRGVRVFKSADGSVVIPAKQVCVVCGSWNLMPVGLGVEQVLEYCEKQFPHTRTLLVEPTKPRGVKELTVALSEGGVILVGTESMLGLVPSLCKERPLALAVIASMDSLLSVPFWRARERFARNLFTLRTFAERTVLVSRKKDDSALTAALSPVPDTLFAEENELRKALSFPPYGTLVLIECVSGEERGRREMEKLMTALESYAPTLLPERKIRTGVRHALLLHIGSNTDRNEAFRTISAHIPPYMAIHIDPETFW